MGTKKKTAAVRKRRGPSRRAWRWSLKFVAVLAVLGFTTLVRCGAPGATARGFRSDDLAQAIQDKNLTTIDEVIEAIPAEARTKYVLMRTSRSSQKAKPESPRAIVFADEGKFIFTFNGGDPTLKGHDSIEVVEFDDVTERFQFRAFQEEGNGKLVSVSEKNPGDCVSCHQSPPRPNWESYPEWPGAYGFDQDLMIPDSPETKEFQAFVKKAKDHPRYSKLLGLDTYAKTRAGQRPQDDDEGGPTDFRMVGRPNARLTEDLFALNARRVAREMLAHPGYPKAKWALAATLLRCESFDKLVPKTKFSQVARFMTLLPQLRSMADRKGFSPLFPDGLRRKDFENHPFHNLDVARFQTVALWAGFDVRNWSMQPSWVNGLNFRAPSRTHLDDILAEALKRDPRMKKYAVRDEEDKTRVRESLCRDLEREAIVVD